MRHYKYEISPPGLIIKTGFFISSLHFILYCRYVSAYNWISAVSIA